MHHQFKVVHFIWSVKMPEKIFIPPLLKVIIAVVGSLFALVLGGHIQDGKIDTRNWVFWSTFLFSISISLFGGSFVIEHFGFSNYGETSKGFIYLMVAVFGALFVSTGYRVFQLSTNEKTLSEIIDEVKKASQSFLK